MGKAKIVGGGADGLYTIEIDYGAESQAKKTEDIASELEQIDASVKDHEAALSELTPMLDAAAARLNALINAYEMALLQEKDEDYRALVPDSLMQSIQAHNDALQSLSQVISNSNQQPAPTQAPTLKNIAQKVVDLAIAALDDAKTQQQQIQSDPTSNDTDKSRANKIVDLAEKNLEEARAALDATLELTTELDGGELWKLINCCC